MRSINQSADLEGRRADDGFYLCWPSANLKCSIDRLPTRANEHLNNNVCGK